MSEVQAMLEANRPFAESFTGGDLEVRGATGVDVSDEEYLSFEDPEETLREDVARLQDLKTLPDGVAVSGLMYDVRTGELREVVPA